MKKTLFIAIALIGSLQAAEPQSYWNRFASWWSSTTPSQYIPSAATCKAFAEENQKTCAAIGFGLGTTLLAGYAWYRWYNQLERQILRAATAGNIYQTGNLLKKLVLNVILAKDRHDHDLAKKQVAALNIFRALLTTPKVYDKVNEIGRPYYIEWTLAEFEPVTKHLFEHSVTADTDLKQSILNDVKKMDSSTTTSLENVTEPSSFPTANAAYVTKIGEIVGLQIINATNADNKKIRNNNPEEADAIINAKLSGARQALNTITNLATRDQINNILNFIEKNAKK